MRVSGVLQNKGGSVSTIGTDETVAAVVAALSEHGVGALVVSDDGRHIDGIVSERDVVRALSASGPDVMGWPVHEIMTTAVVTCDPATPIDVLAGLMTNQRIRHVPVLAGGELVGIVSIGDVVKVRISELETETEAMREYVWNGR
jgi:CBS domain-containing protein